MYQDERKLDFKPLGIAIKKAREAKGWTQEYLAQLVDLTPRSIMYIENRGQHPRLNKFYLITTLLDISVDQFFFPCNEDGDNNRRKQVDVLLNDMEEKELRAAFSTEQSRSHRRQEHRARIPWHFHSCRLISKTPGTLRRIPGFRSGFPRHRYA